MSNNKFLDKPNYIENSILSSGTVSMKNNFNLDGNQVINLGTPINNNDAARYTDLLDLAAQKLNNHNPTSTGTLTAGTSTKAKILSNGQIIVSAYGIDSQDTGFTNSGTPLVMSTKSGSDIQLNSTGKTICNSVLDMASNLIINLSNPVNSNDGVNKQYLDQEITSSSNILNSSITSLETKIDDDYIHRLSHAQWYDKYNVNYYNNTRNILSPSPANCQIINLVSIDGGFIGGYANELIIFDLDGSVRRHIQLTGWEQVASSMIHVGGYLYYFPSQTSLTKFNYSTFLNGEYEDFPVTLHETYTFLCSDGWNIYSQRSNGYSRCDILGNFFYDQILSNTQGICYENITPTNGLWVSTYTNLYQVNKYSGIIVNTYALPSTVVHARLYFDGKYIFLACWTHIYRFDLDTQVFTRYPATGDLLEVSSVVSDGKDKLYIGCSRVEVINIEAMTYNRHHATPARVRDIIFDGRNVCAACNANLSIVT
jgi:hypothetical protein